MTERIKHARKATSRVSYVDSLDSNASDSGEEEPRLMKRKRVGKGSARRKEVEAAEDSDDENDEDFGTKRRKTVRRKAKSKAKKAKKDLMKTLPAELIAEILSYCHSGDLLSLYATFKTYRALLGSKASAPIWRKSRLLVGLPDVPVEGFSELHYSQLIFGKKCELCGKGSSVYGNLSLRIRFCRECRNDHYVKLRHLAKTDPDYHPLTSQVVPYTTTSPARYGWREKEKYALRGDLDAYSEILFNLENEDDGDLELLKLNAALGKSRRSSTRARTGAVEAETAVRSRVERFVEEKKLEIAAGVVSHKAYSKWRMKLDIDQQNALVDQALLQAQRVRDPDFDFDQPSQGYVTDRLPWEWKWFGWLRERVQETKDIEKEAFYTSTFYRSKVVKHIQHTTDAVWDDIGPSVIKAAERALVVYQAQQAKAAEVERCRRIKNERLQHLRIRYDAFKDGENDDFNRDSYPLFSTCLTFDSIEPFLPVNMLESDDSEDEDDVKVSNDAWEAALPAVQEEIEALRIDLVVRAVKLILDATTEGDVPSDDEILENLKKYDAAFFARATSFLVCSHPKCYFQGGYSKVSGKWERLSGRDTKVLPLPDLLHHQHLAHNDEHTYLYDEKGCKPPTPSSAPFHLDLPLEVSCAMSALLDLGDLDDETAGKEDLDEMSRKCYLEWENTRIHSKWFGE